MGTDFTRRNFMQIAVAAAAATVAGPLALAANNPGAAPGAEEKKTDKKIWACLLHVSVNMWDKHAPELQLSESLWHDALKKMSEAGLTMVVMDIGDAVRYQSHPEIAVKNAWSTSKLKEELARIRELGMEPIPKLNFSHTHDSWLGEYHWKTGEKLSGKYYDVCRDLIGEIIQLYDTPRFFHLGKDEEFGSSFTTYYASDPQRHLYWSDMYFLLSEVVKGGARPWVWQDYARKHREDVARMMPKHVLQSNWSNGSDIEKPKTQWRRDEVQGYLNLEAEGYDQAPGGSNYYPNTDDCFLNNVKFCTANIADQRLLGFIQSPWKHTTEDNRAHILKSIEMAGEAKKWFESMESKHKI